VRDVHSYHVRLKTLSVRDAGDQLSKNPDGKVVREEQSRHASAKSVPDEVSINGKDVREEQPSHALMKLVPDEVLIDGKDVRELQPSHE
jgi:hypothetical protein